jgi:hypothetical protein
MVAITDSDGWVPVTRPEITDIALGGNETNFPGKFFRELASRDQYLYEQALGGDAQSIASAVAFRQLGIAAVAQGRLTLETGVPVSTTDQTAKTTLYYTPYTGDYVALYDTGLTRWDLYQFTERSLSLSGLAANTNYDLFLWNNSGTLTLEAVAWSNSGAGTSTRASSISQLEGIWVKNSDKRRYLGTIRTTATTGQCEDSKTRRFVFNAANVVSRVLAKYYTAAVSWTSNTGGAWRAINNDTSNASVYFVCGLPVPLNLFYVQAMQGSVGAYSAIGKNTVLSPSGFIFEQQVETVSASAQSVGAGFYGEVTDVGYHFFALIEKTSGLTNHEGSGDQSVGVEGFIFI